MAHAQPVAATDDPPTASASGGLARAALCGSALAVLGLNWTLVPPRGTLAVQRPQDALLLLLLASVLAAAVALVHRLRRQAVRAARHQQPAEQLRQWADALRDGDDPAPQAGLLQAALVRLEAAPAALLISRQAPPVFDNLQAVGTTDADEHAGLAHCLCQRQRQAMGLGTGLHGSLAQWHLPVRGSASTVGAALLRLAHAGHGNAALRAHTQAPCDQFGAALQQHCNRQAAQAAEGQAQLQAVRNALLTAISHDRRTPLATILGAASSLHDQGPCPWRCAAAACAHPRRQQLRAAPARRHATGG